MKRESGFLLMELLLTLALLAIMLPALLGLIQAGRRMLSHAGEQAEVLFLAVECMENLRTVHFCDLAGMAAGPVPGFPGLLYEVRVEETAQNEGALPLKDISVSVHTSDNRQVVRLVTWQAWR